MVFSLFNSFSSRYFALLADILRYDAVVPSGLRRIRTNHVAENNGENVATNAYAMISQDIYDTGMMAGSYTRYGDLNLIATI